MAIGSSNIDFWEIKRYLTLALGSSATPDGNPIPLGDFVTGNSNRYLNPEQTITASGNSFPANTTNGISLNDFANLNYFWNNDDTSCTLEYVAPQQYIPASKRFTYSNGGADTGSWNNPHCRLMPKWRDDQTSGSGVAQNRVCYLNAGRFDILTPNGNNGTSNQVGNSNWSTLNFVRTGNTNNPWTLNRSSGSYTLVGDGYGYTTSSGYSVERWTWSTTGAPTWITTSNTSDQTVYVTISKG